MSIEKSGRELKEDLGATVRLLNGILDKGSALARHIDTQSNILIGVSSVIFVFASSRLSSADEKLFILLAIFAALSALLALLAVHPPRFMRKRGQTESLLYNKRISEFPSSEEYRRELEKIIGDEDAIIGQYATEIYNLYRYSYRPKRVLWKLSRNFLLAGISLSFLWFLFRLYF